MNISNKKENKSSPLKANRGFSILELLIYMAIFSIISLALIDIIGALSRGWTRSQVEAEVQQNLRYAVNSISQDIKNASSVTTPDVNLSSNNLDLNLGGVSYKYFLTGLNPPILQKQISLSAAENVTTDKVKVIDIKFYTFLNQASTNSQIQATTTQFFIKIGYNSNNPEFSYQQSATSTINLRQ
ncbi:MAG: prepilin-type N-terminal cleavage/methylation domain-containing protein [Patescibacteria group bacterium]